MKVIGVGDFKIDDTGEKMSGILVQASRNELMKQAGNILYRKVEVVPISAIRRNCDKYRTKHDAAQAFLAYCKAQPQAHCKKRACTRCIIEWVYASVKKAEKPESETGRAEPCKSR